MEGRRRSCRPEKIEACDWGHDDVSETRCFEKVTGRVVQVWQISREGIRCHMGWGRVGGRQRGQTMTLGDEAHAERHFKKKISEKKRQGYVEVDVDPVVKPVRASAEAMADASLFDVMLEENKHLIRMTMRVCRSRGASGCS